MNFKKLAADIKPLDLTLKPAISAAEQDYFRFYGLDFEARYVGLKHYFGHFPCGRFDIVAHYFEPKDAVKTCFIVHGYFDHAGLYKHIIEYCLQRNFAVVIYDLPGHGLSTGEPASIHNFSDYQDVLQHVVLYFKDVAPRPWYAIGQSTGAAILMDFLLSGGENVFTKTVLLAPLVRPKRWWLSKIAHSVVRYFVKNISRTFTANSHDHDFLEWVRNEDPLQSRFLPLQWVTALKQWLQYFYRLPAIDYTLLVIQGKQDDTVDWKYNLSAIQKKFNKARLFYINTGRHQLANESDEVRQLMYSAMDIYFDVDKN